jgi:hypothetical protein
MKRLDRNQAIWLARCTAFGVTLTATRASSSDDLSDEQIYMVATSIDLRPWPPAVDVCVYGPKGDVCATTMASKTSRSSWVDARSGLDVMRGSSRLSLWRPNGGRAPSAWAEDTFFLIAFMEHLSGRPSVVCSLVLQAVGDAMQMPAAMSRDDRVSTLINVMNRTIDLANGGPNFASAIELGLTAREIEQINSKGCLTLHKHFLGYGGCYKVTLLIHSQEQRSCEFIARNGDGKLSPGSPSPERLRKVCPGRCSPSDDHDVPKLNQGS